MELKRRHKIFLIALPIYWLAIFFATHTPHIPDWMISNKMSDKTLHFLCYFGLVFLARTAANPYHRVQWRKKRIWIVLASTIIYAILDEYFQPLSGRTCDPMDFLADMAGIATGVFIMSVWTFWPACLVYTCVSIFIITNLSHVNTIGQSVLINSLFHFLGYTLATILWIHSSTDLLRGFKSKTIWLLKAVSLPLLLLAVVKGYSPFTGKTVYMIDVLTAVAGILIAALASLCTGLFTSRYINKGNERGTPLL